MGPMRRKAHPLSNLFRRGKGSSPPVAEGDQHDDSQTRRPTISVPASRNRTASSADSGDTLTQSQTPSPQIFSDSPPPAYNVASPTTNKPSTGSGSEETDTNLQRIPVGEDQVPSLPTKAVTPSIDSRSYSGPAILYRPETRSGNPSNQLQDNDSHDPALDNPMKLWDEAYDQLKRLDPAIVEAYEKILSQDYETAREAKRAQDNVIEQDDWKQRRSQMDRILNNVLQNITKPTGAERIMTDAIDVLLSLKGVIGNSLQPVPVAALAWTGVCIGLQVNEDSLGDVYFCLQSTR